MLLKLPPPIADMRQKKKGKRIKKDLSKKTTKASKVSKTTKKKKSESMETSKTVAVSEEMTNCCDQTVVM